MNTHADKIQENKTGPAAADSNHNTAGEAAKGAFVDNRPEIIAQRKVRDAINTGPVAEHQQGIKAMADQRGADAPQARANTTGLPDNLKAGIEELSGLSMDDVKVYFGSARPAQLQAHAYAQGSDIHIAPGQEKHLPHEAWHVVQQKQGRVKANRQLKQGIPVNDESGLEQEADRMGAKALQKAQSGPLFRRTEMRTLPAQAQPVQRTAWKKEAQGWVRRPYIKGHIEWSDDTERTPPPAQIGEVGWYYSSSTNSYYTDYGQYRNGVRPYKDEELPAREDKSAHAEEKRNKFNASYNEPPQSGKTTIMTTDLEAEDRLLKEESGKIEFSEDITHNYLLWSVPKYTGENLRKETGTSIEDVSGEAAAEAGVRRKEGYMMKQTQEHIEALSAIKMIQTDENIQPKDILSQYGETKDPKKVDPLHNPRDPEFQSDFISILKLVEDVYEKGGGSKGSIAKKVTEATNDPRLPGLIESMANVHGSKKDFNKAFFDSGIAAELEKALAKNKGAKGPRDDAEEVTRAYLKDKTDPSLHLVGGRQAVFDTIWGPKSADVVKKAADRNDAIRSHGLTYHWNPSMTVQAQHEFPPYLALVKKKLEPVMPKQKEKVQAEFALVIKALETIIAIIKEIKPRGEAMAATDLPGIRAEQMKLITEKNNEVRLGMGYIRENLIQ